MILICRACFRVRLKEVHPLATNAKTMLITRQSHQGMKSVPEFITQLVQWWCLSVPDGLIFVTRSKWARAGSNSNIFILSLSLQNPPGYSSDRLPPTTIVMSRDHFLRVLVSPALDLCSLFRPQLLSCLSEQTNTKPFNKGKVAS